MQPLSAFTCTGRSACRNAPIATSTAMSGTRRSTKAASCARSPREIATTAARAPGRSVSSIFFGGGTPSLMQPQTVGAILDAIARHWRVAPDARSHAGSQSDQRRGRRAFAATAPPASTACRSACRRWTIASLADAGTRCTPRAKRSMRSAIARTRVRALFVRSDLRASATRRRRMWARRAEARDLAEAGEHLSLYQLTIEPDTPFCRAACRRQAEDAGRRPPRARFTTSPRRSAPRMACRPTRFPTTRGPARECRHNLVYWRGERICRHRSRRAWPARYRRDPARDRDRKAARSLADARRGARARRRHRRCAQHARKRADEFLLMGLRLAEGIDPARYAACRRPPLDPARIAVLREEGARRDRRPTAACASRCRDFPCSMPWSPILAA